MGRTKKEVAVAAEAEGTVDLIPPVEGGDEIKKAAGRGKRKGKDVATSENSPPKRTLRSNSKTSLVVEKEVVAEEKKGRKAPAKSKKVEEVNTDSDASENTDAPVVNGNGLLKNKAENGVASEEDVQVDKAAPEKSGKGRKKNEKTAPAVVNGETLKETEKKETKQTDDSETLKNDNADKEKSKPVKATNGKGKKKAENKPVQADSEEVTAEPEAPVNDKEEEAKEKEKAASGKGKKKAEKKEEEVVAPKKTKKEAPAAAKPAKGAKGAEAEETKEEKEVKPVAGEAKKAAVKGKSAKAKEVAIEHWNAERVKKILAPFCNPSIVFSINTKSTPRRGAFEIIVVNDDDEEQVMWSGLKLGPPRREKFPSDEKLEELAVTFFSD